MVNFEPQMSPPCRTSQFDPDNIVLADNGDKIYILDHFAKQGPGYSKSITFWDSEYFSASKFSAEKIGFILGNIVYEYDYLKDVLEVSSSMSLSAASSNPMRFAKCFLMNSASKYIFDRFGDNSLIAGIGWNNNPWRLYHPANDTWTDIALPPVCGQKLDL